MRKKAVRAAMAPAAVAAANGQFRVEAERYSLQYRCEACVYVRQGTLACHLGYPNDLLARGEVRARDEQGGFVFCRDFEYRDE